jgi:hypothetical protein
MRRRLIFASFFLPFCVAVSHAGGEVSDKRFPRTSQEWMDHLSNPRLNSLSARNPKAFAALMDAACDPRFLASAMLAGANPQTYLSYLQGLPDPQSLRNGLKAMTPENAMDWAYSTMDPEFQKALLSRTSDPQMASRWMEAMRDPAYFQSAVAVFKMPMQWMKVEADGNIAQPLANWLDPKTYRGWTRLMTRSVSSDAKKSAYAASGAKPLVFRTLPQRY